MTFFSIEPYYKKVRMTKALSIVVEKARWCSANARRLDEEGNYICGDVANDWVSAIETDSSVIKVGFHKPGNTFHIKFLGFDLGPWYSSVDQCFVNVKIEEGAVLCQ
ncbi:hypothetical protein SAMN05720469_10917 [Fibrobacter intestinalis]|uniref:Uncharacterized protein n=2 Tax=Fibrobacter intestinalis TaxID=28122 RepID=A0A1M6T8I1_9BACT|nr:hypothetical protein BGX14_1649 [Fibrobacter sp. UWS1]SHK53078.1 hypothetical protein SAMN05720469_10917 [Fibrobacter intestinalis]